MGEVDRAQLNDDEFVALVDTAELKLQTVCGWGSGVERQG